MPLQLEIVSPERRAYADEVDMVVVPGIDGELAWRASPALTLKAAAFVNDSDLRPNVALPDGRDMKLALEGEPSADDTTTRVLSVTQSEQRFVFLDVPARPVPSLARDFSAPIDVKYDYDIQRLTHLMAHDADRFNRWEAGQRLATTLMLKGIEDFRAGRPFGAPEAFVDAFARVLADAPADPAFAAEALSLPSETYLAEQMAVVDPDAIHAVRTGFARTLGEVLRDAAAAACAASIGLQSDVA